MKRVMIVAAALSLSAAQASAADPAEGLWLVQSGDAKVKIAPCGAAPGRLCGSIVWLRAPRDEAGQPKHDAHNPNPALQDRPILGLTMISDFKPAGPGRWEDGKIYDPKAGRTYDSKMHVGGDGTLRVAGCIVFFCQTQTWTRTQ